MLSDYEQALISKNIYKQSRFLLLSLASLMTGLSLAEYYAWKAFAQPEFNPGIHIVVVILILLNARQNLRQHYLANLLSKLRQHSSMPAYARLLQLLR